MQSNSSEVRPSLNIRQPNKGDDLDALFTDMESTVDKSARDILVPWLKEQRARVFAEQFASTTLVAVRNNRIIGLIRFPTWRDRAWIRLLYVLSGYRDQRIEELLLTEALRRLNGSHLSNIHFNPGIKPFVEPTETFRSEGFKTLSRVTMEKNVETFMEPVTLPDGYTVRNWNLNLIDDFAATLHTIFDEPHIDAILVPELSTLDDTKAYLRGIAESLDPATTLLLLHEDRVCGVSECERVKDTRGLSDEDLRKMPMGFVRSIGLLQDYRGKGLGELLMKLVLKRLAGEGIRYVRLAVTVENVPAFNLYRKLGFTELFRWTDHYWKPRP